jgi:hypothetical protein
MDLRRAGCAATRTSGSEARAGETGRSRGRYRAPVRPYDLLRCGATSQVLGHRVMAPSTLGTFLRSFTAKLLPAIALPVEDDRMQVNPPAAAVDQDQPCRQAGQRGRVVLKAHTGQRCSRPIAVITGDDQVQVLVGPGVAAKQRINPPSAVKPHHQPGTVELVENPEHVGGVQHRRSQPPPERDNNRLSPPPSASRLPERAGETLRRGSVAELHTADPVANRGATPHDDRPRPDPDRGSKRTRLVRCAEGRLPVRPRSRRERTTTRCLPAS